MTTVVVTKVEPEPEEEEDDGFTQRQWLFVKYYLVNFNATQAAIKAGYSPKAAKEIGYRLLTFRIICFGICECGRRVLVCIWVMHYNSKIDLYFD